MNNDTFFVFLDALKKEFQGDIDYSEDTLATYSTDASLFSIKPQIVVFPKNVVDISNLIRLVDTFKKDIPNLSITPRAAGTDMSGGAINDSIILDVNRYLNHIISVSEDSVVVQPGCMYRDLEKKLSERGRVMPAYTASKNICAIGGMVANNAGGEKSIKHGKIENFVESIKMVLADGNEYVFQKMKRKEFLNKTKQNDFEGEIYKKILYILETHQKDIQDAKPTVSKNSAGYYLWNVYDSTDDSFDICKIITGSQGTLGIITEVTLKTVPIESAQNLLVVFLPDTDKVGDLVKTILPFKPESIETYDDYSMKLALTFFFDFFKQLGFWGAIRLGFSFIPEAFMMLKGGLPKLILLIEVTGKDIAEVEKTLVDTEKALSRFGYQTRIARSENEAKKYWTVRHESFNLLRNHLKGKRTAPFIDDVIVRPEMLPEFMPQLESILKRNNLIYTIAGHLGDGNFHIIPLMDFTSPFTADSILSISKEVYDLVLKYGGSITAEHNDGIIRTPFLKQMYGEKMYALFGEVKVVFDSLNIFNPRKKFGGTIEDIRSSLQHI